MHTDLLSNENDFVSEQIIYPSFYRVFVTKEEGKQVLIIVSFLLCLAWIWYLKYYGTVYKINYSKTGLIFVHLL